jgi:hypothetical protein
MKEKSKAQRTRPDTDVNRRHPSPASGNRNRRSGENNGAVNSGNTINSVRSQETGELHTKKSVSGSDSDGQAE